jgi:hypothetical protein
MKKFVAALLLSVSTLIGAACDQNNPVPADDNQLTVTEGMQSMSDTLVVKIGLTEFTAILFDNPTANAFKAMLPLAMDMKELNRNEKYFDLAKSMPTNASNPGKINPGDLLLYGSNTLVLFYEAFSTSYTYTRLGKINNASGLAQALGSGNVVITMKLK